MGKSPLIAVTNIPYDKNSVTAIDPFSPESIGMMKIPTFRVDNNTSAEMTVYVKNYIRLSNSIVNL